MSKPLVDKDKLSKALEFVEDVVWQEVQELWNVSYSPDEKSNAQYFEEQAIQHLKTIKNVALNNYKVS